MGLAGEYGSFLDRHGVLFVFVDGGFWYLMDPVGQQIVTIVISVKTEETVCPNFDWLVLVVIQ